MAPVTAAGSLAISRATVQTQDKLLLEAAEADPLAAEEYLNLLRFYILFRSSVSLMFYLFFKREISAGTSDSLVLLLEQASALGVLTVPRTNPRAAESAASAARQDIQRKHVLKAEVEEVFMMVEEEEMMEQEERIGEMMMEAEILSDLVAHSVFPTPPFLLVFCFMNV